MCENCKCKKICSDVNGETLCFVLRAVYNK